jgi:8-oxo-dGTP diphosphatase
LFVLVVVPVDFLAMALYLIRHAKAGKKSLWDGADTSRPLDDMGRLQSKALAGDLAAVTPTWLVSSPFLRCIQTLEELSALTGLPILTDERLAEDGDVTAIIRMLEQAPDGAVLCSHGDMIPAVIRTLEGRGMQFTTVPDWRKASVWVLERDGELVTMAAAWPPPSII